MAVFIFVARVA